MKGIENLDWFILQSSTTRSMFPRSHNKDFVLLHPRSIVSSLCTQPNEHPERKVYYKTTTNRGKRWLNLKNTSVHLNLNNTRFYYQLILRSWFSLFLAPTGSSPLQFRNLIWSVFVFPSVKFQQVESILNLKDTGPVQSFRRLNCGQYLRWLIVCVFNFILSSNSSNLFFFRVVDTFFCCVLSFK